MTGASDTYMRDTDDYIEYMYPVMSDDTVKSVILIKASLDKQNRLESEAIKSNSVIAAVILVICVILAVVLGFACTKGIKFINQQMERARDGHVDEKIPERGFTEFKAITENYNKTISKLMQVDSSRQEFVSNVSHELKTPITSMKVLADSLLQNEEADLDMYKEFMTDIVEEIDRESQIITDLLTLVKTDKDSGQLNMREVDINTLLEIIIKRVTPLAQARGIELTYENYRNVTACVDDVKLSLALSNIIENAVKYNIDNGWIKVTLNADGKNFHIKVADSGVGIPDDCKDRVFERFYRVDKARSRDTGGTGLGLSITRNIVLMHDGSIKLYSESGVGTTFTIKIPINMEEEA
jgi:signal transduction histidine kinase